MYLGRSRCNLVYTTLFYILEVVRLFKMTLIHWYYKIRRFMSESRLLHNQIEVNSVHCLKAFILASGCCISVIIKTRLYRAIKGRL